LQLRWDLGPNAAGWLTTVVQLGFVAGTAVAAVLNLADLWPAKWLVAGSCLVAALANVLVAAPHTSFVAALCLRFLTGFFLAGVYPPGMKMMATWFVSNRGLAIGALVGALTLGKAAPYLVRAFPHASASVVVLSASIGATVAALIAMLFYRDGPHSFERRPFSWKLVGAVVTHRETRLAIAGYLGHMWELYAMWTLIAVFFYEKTVSTAQSGAIAFVVIATGAVGCVIAGKIADRVGRERVTIWSMIISGLCASLMGWTFHAASAVAIAVAVVWGFAIVADSAQFSAIVTEVSPRHAVGTALTLQTSLGFLLTAFTIWLTIQLHTAFDWRVAFGMLAVGPALGIIAMIRLKQLRRLS
jgi:MFS family permease